MFKKKERKKKEKPMTVFDMTLKILIHQAHLVCPYPKLFSKYQFLP